MKTIVLNIDLLLVKLILVYTYIYIYGILLEERVSNIGSFLRYITFDEELAQVLNSKGFILDSINRLKSYIQNIIELLDELVNEYISHV